MAAKHDQTSPRYQVLRTRRRDSYHERHLPQLPAIVVVVPNDITIEDKRLAQPYARETQRLRYGHALQVAADYARDHGAVLLDLSGGDLRRSGRRCRSTRPARAACRSGERCGRRGPERG